MTYEQAIATRDVPTIARFIRAHRRFQRAFMGRAKANSCARADIAHARAVLAGGQA